MNHCILEVEVKEAPKLRFTQDNKTPIAEMEVQFDGLRADDPPSTLKVVGWGNMAEDLQNRVQTGQRLLLEGRLRMNTVPRQDGTKEKRAELTLSKLHLISESSSQRNNNQNLPAANNPEVDSQPSKGFNPEVEAASWNSAPLVPDTDDIPF